MTNGDGAPAGGGFVCVCVQKVRLNGYADGCCAEHVEQAHPPRCAGRAGRGGGVSERGNRRSMAGQRQWAQIAMVAAAAGTWGCRTLDTTPPPTIVDAATLPPFPTP
eukprot:363625-Chlamydomonas_euryale.AAC.12